MAYINTEAFFSQELVQETNTWLYVNLIITYNHRTLFQKHDQQKVLKSNVDLPNLGLMVIIGENLYILMSVEYLSYEKHSLKLYKNKNVFVGATVLLFPIC